MESTLEKVGMSLDEFIHLMNDAPFELINGERKVKLPNVAGHNAVAHRIWKALNRHLEQFPLGEALHEDVFVISYTSNWVTGSRIPDVMFFRVERLAEYRRTDPDWKNKPYVLVPDLVIEVVSPNDSYSELDDKVDLYLLDGVEAVWVLDPQKKRIAIHQLLSREPFQKKETYLQIGDLLKGNEIIPGFEMPVSSVLE